MNGVISYTSSNILVCGNSNGYYTKLEFTTQSLTSWSADTLSATGGLPSISWTSGLTAISDFPFTNPTISTQGNLEAGIISAGTLQLEADNQSISGVRVYSMLRNYDADNEIMHCRFAYKTSITGAWTYRFFGTVDHKSIEVSCSDLNDPDTYLIRFNVNNCLELLQERTITQIAEDKFKHKYNDVTVANKYISVIGSNYKSVPASRYLLTRWFYNNDYEHNSSIGWLPTSGESSPNIPLRWYSLVDIFKKASEYLGLELPVNNGASWSSLVSTLYGINTATGTTTMDFVGIDRLYYCVGTYVNSIYGNVFGFWDETEHAPYSFHQYSNVLELIKGVCVSLGLICSVESTSTGQRYLYVREAAHYSTDTAITQILKDNEENISSDIKYNPYFRKTSGINVVSSIDTAVTRGSNGNDSVSLDCVFGSANFVIISNVSNVDTTTHQITTREDFRLLGSLWASIETPYGSYDDNDGTSKLLNTLYTVCAIIPRMNGIVSTLSGTDYEFKVKNANAVVDYGAYQTTYGGYTINGVMYPALSTTNTFTELPAMALAHYYYSPKIVSRDQVGIYRSKSRSLKIKASGILNTIDVGQLLIIRVEDSYTNWYVTSKTENYTDFTTELELETRDA